jgi:drug/metabolite transporter (DMT)-like permease
MNRNKFFPIAQALLAAVLFGVSAPLAKLLLGDIQPVMLAGHLYLGSGLGLLILKGTQGLTSHGNPAEAKLAGRDYAWLAGAILAGGIAAPILLLVSLEKTPASTASLLLNFEAVATALIAWLAFREALGKRALAAIILITIAGILLSFDTSGTWGISLGALGILAACIFWGMDNNFTRNISAKDPIMITMIKGLAGGTFSTILALSIGNSLPSAGTLLGALLLGSLSYGASIVLFIRAMRGLGAARTSALFNISPLVGVILSLILFRNQPGWMFYLTIPLLALGAYLLMSENHAHPHHHEPMVHEHMHTHNDGHHTHIHEGVVAGSHSHMHTHEDITHNHDHLPDIHHRHGHKDVSVSETRENYSN